jgi:hypothetical protein
MGPSRVALPAFACRVETGLLLGGLLMLLFSPGSLVSDGEVRFQALNALLERGEVSDTAYSLVGPLGSAPLWLLGRAWRSPEWCCLFYNRLVFFGGLFALDRLLRQEVSGPVRRRFLLLLVFASMFPHHLQFYFGEVFTTVLAAVGVVAVGAGRGGWGWACLVLATVNAPAAVVGLALVAGWTALQTHRGRHLLAVVAATALVLLEAWLRRGHPLTTGYESAEGARTVLPYSGRPGFSYPLFFGLLSIVLSFGKGLVFYAPGLLLPVPAGALAESASPSASRSGATLPAAHRLWLLFLLGLVLVYARWWSWYGGWFWGPRFFLFASLPASLALAVCLVEAPRLSLGRNLLTLAALALSFWVGLNGLTFGQSGLEMCQDKDLEMLLWYVPEFSALWRPFVVPPHLPEERALWVGATVAGALYAACFLYLAGPLALICIRQAAQALRCWREEQAKRGPWRW